MTIANTVLTSLEASVGNTANAITVVTIAEVLSVAPSSNTSAKASSTAAEVNISYNSNAVVGSIAIEVLTSIQNITPSGGGWVSVIN